MFEHHVEIDRRVLLWVDPAGGIALKAIEPLGAPLDLSSTQARMLAAALLRLAEIDDERGRTSALDGELVGSPFQDPLAAMQAWYLAQCDGDWEHDWGVEINTLDNPGWRVKVNLVGTRLEGLTRDYEKVERSEDDWLHWWIADSTFHAACGPLNLTSALEAFLTLDADRPETPAPSVEPVDSGPPERPSIRDSDGDLRVGRDADPADIAPPDIVGVDLDFIRIDNQVRLQFGAVEIVVDGNFTLVKDGRSLAFDSYERSELGPALALYSNRLEGLVIRPDATLVLTFQSGHTLISEAAQDGEAWEIRGPGSALIVCNMGESPHLSVWE